MYPRALPPLYFDDSASQFGLEHRLIARTLHQGAVAERRILLNHLDSHRIALREPLARQANAGFLNLGFRHGYRTRGAELEFDARGRQRVHDLAALTLGKLPVQHAVILPL